MELRNRKPRSIVLEFDEDKLNVQLKKAIKYGRLREFIGTESPEKVVDFLLEYIEDWDLTIDGQKVALTREGLDEADADVLNAIMTNIMENPTTNSRSKR
jgi:hypothetical protein